MNETGIKYWLYSRERERDAWVKECEWEKRERTVWNRMRTHFLLGTEKKSLTTGALGPKKNGVSLRKREKNSLKA